MFTTTTASTKRPRIDDNNDERPTPPPSPQQQRYATTTTAATTSPTMAGASINHCPDELLEQIMFNLLPYDDLDSCALVCKRWLCIVHNVRRLTHQFMMRCLSGDPHARSHPARTTYALHWQEHPGNRDLPTGGFDAQRRPPPIPRLLERLPQQPAIAPRFSHSTCRHRNAMYVFGGASSSSTTFNDLWCLDLSTRRWHRPQTTGEYPTPKASASMAAYDNRLIVFGGWRHPSQNIQYQSWRLFNELHVYDVVRRHWTHVRPPAPGSAPESPQSLMGLNDLMQTDSYEHAIISYPPPMTGHTVSVHGHQMILIGGFQQLAQTPAQQAGRPNEFGREFGLRLEDPEQNQMTGCSNTVWSLDLRSFRWMERPVALRRPPARYGQIHIKVDEEHILIMGGCGGPNQMFSDAWMLRMRGPVWKWRQVRVDNARWSATFMWCHPACRLGDKLVMLAPVSATPPDPQLRHPTGMANSQQRNQQQQQQQQQPHGFRQQPPAANADQPANAHHDPMQPQPLAMRDRHHEPNIRPLPSPPTPPPQPPARQPEPTARAPTSPLQAAASVVHRSPQQICEEANRRLEEERQRRSPAGGSPASSLNRSGSGLRPGPGPSSGVLVRRDRLSSGGSGVSAEEEERRRKERNLLLNGHRNRSISAGSGDEEPADALLPKRFNQPPAGVGELAVGGMAAFSLQAADADGGVLVAGSSGGGGGGGVGSNGSPAGQSHAQQTNERRLESLRRIEEKMRANKLAMGGGGSPAATASTSASPTADTQPPSLQLPTTAPPAAKPPSPPRSSSSSSSATSDASSSSPERMRVDELDNMALRDIDEERAAEALQQAEVLVAPLGGDLPPPPMAPAVVEAHRGGAGAAAAAAADGQAPGGQRGAERPRPRHNNYYMHEQVQLQQQQHREAAAIVDAAELSPQRRARRMANSIGIFVCDLAELIARAPLIDDADYELPDPGDRRYSHYQPTAAGGATVSAGRRWSEGGQSSSSSTTSTSSSTSSSSEVANVRMSWLESGEGGWIRGAPQRFILSSLVAGHGELIMFGGLAKESQANALASEVTNQLHFLTFDRQVL